MNTPITDKYKARWATHFPEGVTIYDLARRLELDRAALMEALVRIASQRANRYESTVGFVCNIAESALAAARANFPTP